MAFSMLVGSFSVVVTQFQSISNFTAVLARLEGLYEAIEEVREAKPTITVREEDGRLLYEHVSLFANGAGGCLLKDFSATIPAGTRVLVSSPDEAAGVALFKVTARLWQRGEGTIIRPCADKLLFLAEKPYLPPGTLREILVPVARETQVSDGELESLLAELGLEELPEHVGGLDTEQDWGSFLSLAEQQLLAFIHILLRSPHFVFLDRPGTTLTPDQILKMLNILAKHAVTYVTIGREDQPLELYDVLLEIGEDGSSTWKDLRSRMPDMAP
jgi:putative ATP-binding cassette transporter